MIMHCGLERIINGSVDGHRGGCMRFSLKLNDVHQRLHLTLQSVRVQTELLDNGQGSVSGVDGWKHVLVDVLQVLIVLLDNFRHLLQLGTDGLGILIGYSHAGSLIALVTVERLEAVLNIPQCFQPIICLLWP